MVSTGIVIWSRTLLHFLYRFELELEWLPYHFKVLLLCLKPSGLKSEYLSDIRKKNNFEMVGSAQSVKHPYNLWPKESSPKKSTEWIPSKPGRFKLPVPNKYSTLASASSQKGNKCENRFPLYDFGHFASTCCCCSNRALPKNSSHSLHKFTSPYKFPHAPSSLQSFYCPFSHLSQTKVACPTPANQLLLLAAKSFAH